VDENEAYTRALGCLDAAPVKALAAFDEALRSEPLRARIHANRALALQALGRSDEAAEAGRRGWELDPSDGYVGMRLVEMLLATSDFAAVRDAAPAVLESDLDDEETCFVSNGLAWGLMRVSPVRACEHTAACVERWPQDAETRAAHASALAACCAWDEALVWIDRAIDAAPSDVRFATRKAAIQTARAFGLDMLAEGRAQVEADPRSPRAWREFGLLCARYARGAEALAAFEAAHELSPPGADENGLTVAALAAEATLRPRVALGLPVDPIPGPS